MPEGNNDYSPGKDLVINPGKAVERAASSLELQKAAVGEWTLLVPENYRRVIDKLVTKNWPFYQDHEEYKGDLFKFANAMAKNWLMRGETFKFMMEQERFAPITGVGMDRPIEPQRSNFAALTNNSSYVYLGPGGSFTYDRMSLREGDGTGLGNINVARGAMPKEWPVLGKGLFVPGQVTTGPIRSLYVNHSVGAGNPAALQGRLRDNVTIAFRDVDRRSGLALPSGPHR